MALQEAQGRVKMDDNQAPLPIMAKVEEGQYIKIPQGHKKIIRWYSN